MFGFRLPPDGGRLKKVRTTSISKSSSESSVDSSSDTQTDSSSSDSECNTESLPIQREAHPIEKNIIYEDFMPDNDDSTPSKQNVASSSSGAQDQLMTDFSKHLARYLASIGSTSSGATTVSSKACQETEDETSSATVTKQGQKIEKGNNKNTSIRQAKKPTNKEFARLRKKADSLVRLGRIYNEKVQDFVKELNAEK